MVASPLDVTSQLRRDPCLGSLVFVNLPPRPRAAALVRPTRPLPTCIHYSRHPTRGLWRPHLRKRNDITVQTMLWEDSLRHSISLRLACGCTRRDIGWEKWVTLCREAPVSDPLRLQSGQTWMVVNPERRRILTSVLH